MAKKVSSEVKAFRAAKAKRKAVFEQYVAQGIYLPDYRIRQIIQGYKLSRQVLDKYRDPDGVTRLTQEQNKRDEWVGSVSKTVEVTHIPTGEITVYPSIRKASQELQLPYSIVSKCASGMWTTLGGRTYHSYHFRVK